ncbi:pirin family protein [Acidovorax sp. DW039]|uniref:pirin family protein n=1 Tax=Acidovorax sp. DW039 TaxID=3095606 RepID=UPI00308C5EB0|nr:pirin family protein [Acidovorax sp. DW039]
MALQISAPLHGRVHSSPLFSVNSLPLHAMGESTSPLVMLDDFRVSGRPFPPHPHAGFSAVTYVWEDSATGLRSVDSLGHDVQVGPGGIVWTQAGRGVLHQEAPAVSGRELLGVQFFVNLSSAHKLSAPQTLWLDAAQVPVWSDDEGNSVRVVVGTHGGQASSLQPVEPFTLLDVDLHSQLELEVRPPQRGLVYARSGHVRVATPGAATLLEPGQAAAVRGSGKLHLTVASRARVLYLEGAAIHEPVVSHGPFIMNTRAQLADAIGRYETGQMGQLAPLL